MVSPIDRQGMSDLERSIQGDHFPMRPSGRLTALIDADSDWISWSRAWERRKYLPIPTYDDVLPRFAALATGSLKKIRRFAEDFGPLGICGDHGMPVRHHPGCLTPVIEAPPRPAPGDELQAQHYLDNVIIKEYRRSWLVWARIVRTMLELKRAVRAGEPGDSADWKRVLARPPGPGDNLFDYLAVATNTLLQVARPVPFVSHNGAGVLTMQFASAIAIEARRPLDVARLKTHSVLDGSLFTAIMTALATDVASGQPLVKCSNPDCAQPYIPERAISEGRRHFCGKCRQGGKVSRKLSKRRSRHPEMD